MQQGHHHLHQQQLIALYSLVDITLAEIDADTGDVMYVENRSPITRAADQTENVKLIIEF